jgi:ABC-type branched-subunit amino acid transport system substrate-binding protein
MVSRTGPGGLWAFSSEACAMLASAEINAAGGVLDRPVELVISDAGATASVAEASARDLVEVDGVHAIIGRHPSDVRPAIATGIGGRVPYIYTSNYEGGEAARNVLPIGSTDEQLLGHAIPLLMERRQVRRFFFLGNDYVWPRHAAAAAGRIVKAHGGLLVGMNFLPFGRDQDECFAMIRRSMADVVVTALLGDESVRFNRAFSAAGLSGRLQRLQLAVDETVLYGAGSDAHDNLFVATTYLANVGTAGRDGFAEKYREGFGDMVPPATVFGRSCYDAVHLLARLSQAGRRRGAGALLQKVVRLGGGDDARRGLPPSLLPKPTQIYFAEAQGLAFKALAVRASPCGS